MNGGQWTVDGERGTTVVIRRATVEDAAAVAALAEQTFRETFADGNNAADMDAHCMRAYSPAQQRLEIADPAIDTLVAEVAEGVLAGYAMVRGGGAAAAVQGPAPIELWRIYVDRVHHGRGVAQALMTACVEAARARGGLTLWLGVWEQNPRAQAFYRKLGFVDVGAHVFMLGDDRQTDRVMARAL
ncbi:MAG: GNAT family N-acetyltransferase [Vicinamibacterales bacterium]|nr:GNAT family N-acetyltransferase [Vicinamibacterales bacterium]